MQASDVRKHIHNIAFWVFLPISVVTGYMSGKGVHDLSHNSTMAIGYAIAVGAMVFLLATANMKVIPALDDDNRTSIAWFGLFLSACVAVTSSSYTSICGIAGDSVKELETRNHIEAVQKIVSQTSLSVKNTQSVVSSLNADHQRYLELAKSEIQSGTLSGSKGAGAVSGMYEQAANIMHSASSALDNNKEEITTIIDEATGLLSKMRSVLDEDANIDDRIRAVSRLNRSLQAEYEKLASIGLGRVIGTSVSPLESVIAVATSSNPTLRKKQETAITHIKKEFLKTKETYLAIANAPDITVPAYPAWEPTLTSKLIIKHAENILPYIFGCVFLDLSPFVIVAFLIPLHRQIRTENEIEKGNLDRTVRLDMLDELWRTMDNMRRTITKE